MSFDAFLFIGLPYVALTVFLLGTIYRYRTTAFTYSSLSSGFLEKRTLFWGSLPFHWGIMLLFLGHLVAFLIPSGVLAWNSSPLRLIVLEVSAFAFGLAVLWGLIMLAVRRATSTRVRSVTNSMDVVIVALLLIEVCLGLWTAWQYRWGSSWFAATLTPYLRSIFVFDPEIAAVSAMPWPVKYHIVGAFLIVLLIPFSRLVHVLVVPFHYIWRPYQRVIWYWNRDRVRNPDTEWTVTRPKNT